MNPLLNLIFFTKKKKGRRKKKLLTATTSDRVDASDGRTRAVLLLHQPSAGGEVWWVVRGKGEGTKTPRASFPDRLPVIGRVYSPTCHVITLGGFFLHILFIASGRDPQVHNDKVGLKLQISPRFVRQCRGYGKSSLCPGGTSSTRSATPRTVIPRAFPTNKI